MRDAKPNPSDLDDIDAGWGGDEEREADDVDAGWDTPDESTEDADSSPTIGQTPEEREQRAAARKERQRAKAADKAERRKARASAAAAKQKKRKPSPRRSQQPSAQAGPPVKADRTPAPEAPDLLPTSSASPRSGSRPPIVVIAAVVLALVAACVGVSLVWRH